MDQTERVKVGDAELILDVSNYPHLRFGDSLGAAASEKRSAHIDIPPIPNGGGGCVRISREEAYAFFSQK